jgi:hypothetical protein
VNVVRRSGVPASSMRGNRRTSVPIATAPSSRASDAPRQKWWPPPNATLRFASSRQVLALRDRHATDLIVVQRDALCQLHRAVEAEQLLDRLPVQGRVVAEALELIAVLEQCEGPVADEVHGRLVSRDEQEQRRAEQLLLAQAVAALLGGDERGQQVVAQRVPPALDEVREVLEEGVAGRVDADALVGRDERIGIDARRQLG